MKVHLTLGFPLVTMCLMPASILFSLWGHRISSQSNELPLARCSLAPVHLSIRTHFKSRSAVFLDLKCQQLGSLRLWVVLVSLILTALAPKCFPVTWHHHLIHSLTPGSSVWIAEPGWETGVLCTPISMKIYFFTVIVSPMRLQKTWDHLSSHAYYGGGSKSC